MPTGYTVPVKDGEITEFADYALSCARAFGAMILLRDSDQSLEATRRFIEEEAYNEKPSYHAKELQKAQDRIEWLQSLTDDEVLAESIKEYEEIVAQNQESEARRLLEFARYTEMLSKVRAWEPPTEEHVKFKTFMIEQLEESIRFDCRPFMQAVPAVSLLWRREKIETERRSIEYHKGQLQEEHARNEGRRQWITDLLDSLEV